jgi:uncharacterized protein (DUF1697 family)
MATHIALLRGINVGGNNKVAMAALRELAESLGHTAVATYIQSGNLIFTPGTNAATSALAAQLERAIADTMGVRPAVVVLDRTELADVVARNPYPGEPNPRYVHAVFLPTEASPDVTAGVAAACEQAAAQGSPDTATTAGRVVYLHTPGGFGTSKLAALLLNSKRSPLAAGTARNWATVSKLLAMSGG